MLSSGGSYNSGCSSLKAFILNVSVSKESNVPHVSWTSKGNWICFKLAILLFDIRHLQIEVAHPLLVQCSLNSWDIFGPSERAVFQCQV